MLEAKEEGGDLSGDDRSAYYLSRTESGSTTDTYKLVGVGVAKLTKKTPEYAKAAQGSAVNRAIEGYASGYTRVQSLKFEGNAAAGQLSETDIRCIATTGRIDVRIRSILR